MSGTPVSAMGEPDESGRFGEFGGRFIPESLIPACLELEAQFKALWADPDFHVEYETLLREYAGRPSLLYEAALTVASSGVPGGLRTRLGAVPLQVRR